MCCSFKTIRQPGSAAGGQEPPLRQLISFTSFQMCKIQIVRTGK